MAFIVFGWVGALVLCAILRLQQYGSHKLFVRSPRTEGREMRVDYDFGSCRIIPPPCPDWTVGNCPFHLSISARLFSMRRSSSS
jgi:hypothetical protein